MIAAELQKILSRTPAGRQVLSHLLKSRALHGSADYLGKGKNIFQKIGKYTSKVTGPIANMAARMVGIPPEAMNMLAKADPTAHANLVNSLVKSATGKQAAAAITNPPPPPGAFAFLKNISPYYIIGGVAIIGGGTYLILRKKKRRQ